MTAAVRFLRLSVRCPECGAPPRIRTLPDITVEVITVHPERVILTYECHVAQCGKVYEIKAKHFHEAA